MGVDSFRCLAKGEKSLKDAIRRLIESSWGFYVFDGIDQVIANKPYFK